MNYTGEIRLSEEIEKSGGMGTLSVAGHLKSFVKIIKDEHFPPNTQDQEIHLFAIAIGITQDERLEQEVAKRVLRFKISPTVHIQNLPDLNAFVAILESRGDIEAGESKISIKRISNGGLSYLKRQKADKSSLEDLFEIIPN